MSLIPPSKQASKVSAEHYYIRTCTYVRTLYTQFGYKRKGTSFLLLPFCCRPLFVVVSPAFFATMPYVRARLSERKNGCYEYIGHARPPSLYVAPVLQYSLFGVYSHTLGSHHCCLWEGGYARWISSRMGGGEGGGREVDACYTGRRNSRDHCPWCYDVLK